MTLLEQLKDAKYRNARTTHLKHILADAVIALYSSPVISPEAEEKAFDDYVRQGEELQEAALWFKEQEGKA